MRIRKILLALAAFVLLYFVVGASLLRFAMAPLVFPHVVASARTTAPVAQGWVGSGGDTLLVRRYGKPVAGCVVFFPGQHGMLRAYESDVFPAFVTRGIAVLAVAYPGQDGAAGKPRLREILSLTAQVVASAKATCPGHRVVLYGRSLGAMVAAYTAGSSRPTGLILESAAPSLSSAVRLRLRKRWFLAPLAILPVSMLLPTDYSLADAMAGAQDLPAFVFQGTEDTEAPLSMLNLAVVPANMTLVVVQGGTHSTTDILARERIAHVALWMLRDMRHR